MRKYIIFALALTFVLFHHQSREINYSKLEDLLKQHNWSEADRETTKIVDRILIVAVDRQHFWGYSRIDLFGQERLNILIRKFDCQDVSKLDYLWQKYSNNKYGFSTQSKILSSLVKKSNIHNILIADYQEDFYTKLGWNNNSRNLAQSDIQQIGSLPSPEWLLQNSPKPLGPNGIMLFLQNFYKCKSLS